MNAQQITEEVPLPSALEVAALDGRIELSETPVGRTVRHIGHGGTFVATPQPDDPGADPMTSQATFMPGTHRAVWRDCVTGRFDATTSFDYLFRGPRAQFPAAHLPSRDDAEIARVVAALQKLGSAMAEPSATDATQDSTVPAVYTYWGQFIDHDITLNTNGPDRPPEPGEHPEPGDLVLGDIINEPFRVFAPDVVVRSLHNARHPMLNLDSLYGSGPRFPGEPDRKKTRSEAAYARDDATKLALGRVSLTPIDGFDLVEPVDDAQRDLPRVTAEQATDDAPEGAAVIPDGRNDENLIVAQFHVAMIRFHNAVVDWVRTTEPWLTVDDRAVFDRAQQLVRHHYQWLVLNDYLRTLTKPGVLDEVLSERSLLFRPWREPSMPLEFAAAAFRFGHSMVRNGYDYNRNFGRENPFVPPGPDGNPPAGKNSFASLVQLFQFTGGGGIVPVPSNWPIDWSRFVDKGDPDRRRSARKIDPLLADTLTTMPNEGWEPGWKLGPDGVTVVDENGVPVPLEDIPTSPANRPITLAMSELLKQLAQRNLLRGYMLALPTGEEVAEALHLTPLTPDELTRDAAPEVGEALRDLGGTPLWYYVLKEAQVEGNGNFLGEVGSRILCETFVYLLSHDESSFLRYPGGWTPADGVRLEGGHMLTTLPDLLRFAGVLAFKDGSFRELDGHPAGHDGDL